MEPRVPFHFIDISTLYPHEAETWARLAPLVPAVGNLPDDQWRVTLETSLAHLHDHPTTSNQSIDTARQWLPTSPYGVLCLCLLNSPLFQGTPQTIYALYRKDPHHLFRCTDGPALLAHWAGILLDYEQALGMLRRELSAVDRAWDTVRGTLERSRGSAGKRPRRAQAGTQVGRVLAQADRDREAHELRLMTEYGTDCRTTLVWRAVGVLRQYGPSDPNFDGLPMYDAVATLLMGFAIVPHASATAVRARVKKLLQRSGFTTPRRAPRRQAAPSHRRPN